MKYLSLILIVATLGWSWSIIHESNDITEVVHQGIQDDLKRIISEYIQENLPSSDNLRFERMWTEKVKDTQVKASFMYSFDDSSEDSGNARVIIEGYAVLNRDPKPNEELDVWSFDELYILNNHVVFEEGITIGTESEPEEL
jgi:hypothetical protein